MVGTALLVAGCGYPGASPGADYYPGRQGYYGPGYYGSGYYGPGYAPGYGGERWRGDQRWHGHQSRMAEPARPANPVTSAPPPAPRPPPPAPNAAENRRLLDQLGFQPNR